MWEGAMEGVDLAGLVDAIGRMGKVYLRFRFYLRFRV